MSTSGVLSKFQSFADYLPQKESLGKQSVRHTVCGKQLGQQPSRQEAIQSQACPRRRHSRCPSGEHVIMCCISFSRERLLQGQLKEHSFCFQNTTLCYREDLAQNPEDITTKTREVATFSTDVVDKRQVPLKNTATMLRQKNKFPNKKINL